MRIFSKSLIAALSLSLPVQAWSQTTEIPFNLQGFPYVDVHMHAAFKPFNSRHTGEFNMWQKIDHDCSGNMANFMVNGSKEVPKTSQCNLENLQKGNVRLGYLSLTPMEKKVLNVNLLNEKKKGLATMACLSGASMTKVVESAETLDYYEDFVENVDFVLEGQGVPYYINGQAYSYELVRDAQHLERLLADPTKIALVLNIEGGHTLGHSLEPRDISQTIAYENYYMANVDRIKGLKPLREGSNEYLEYPILSMNLNHFFWNGLSGHARTFSNAQNLVFGQNKGVNAGMTPLGIKVVERMLDKNQGRRILIDIKHMSLDSRRWYYGRLAELRSQGDTVPVISSHSTVAGISWDSKTYQKKDNKAKNKNAYLHLWSISLADEDIQEVHRSKGIIGIMLDKYKLVGDLGKKAMDETVPGSIQRRQVYAKVIWANIFECIDAVKDKSAWDIVAIGSDFDGMITPFETYVKASDMPEMAADLLAYLKNPTDLFNLFTKEEIEQLMYGYTPEELIRKIFYENAYQFTLRNLPKGNDLTAPVATQKN
jgi:microsomal dipeptidase-like Zn-dependent dipeptidase